MTAKDSHLGRNTWREIPSYNPPQVSSIRRKRGFNELSNQYVTNHAGLSANWRSHLDMTNCRKLIQKKIYEFINPVTQNEQLTPILELLLLSKAASKEEYMNLATLNQRVLDQVESALSYSTDSVPEGRLSYPSSVQQLPCLPDHGSSIHTLADMDVLRNNPVSGGRSNLEANSQSINKYFPQQCANNLEMNLANTRDWSGTIQNNETMNFPTTMGKSLETEDSNLIFPPQPASVNISEFSYHLTDLRPCIDQEETWQHQPQMVDFQNNSIVKHDVINVPFGYTKSILQPTKRKKVIDSDFNLSLIDKSSFDQWNWETVQYYSSQTISELQKQSEKGFPLSSIAYESNVGQFTNPMLDSTGNRGINNNVIVDTFGQIFKTETFSSKDLEADQIMEEPGLESHDVMNRNILKEYDTLNSKMHTLNMDPIPTEGDHIQGRTVFGHGIRMNSSMHTLTEVAIPTDVEDIQGTTELETNAEKKVDEPTADPEMQTKSSNTTVSENKKNVVVDTFGQTFENEMVPSKGLEARQISDDEPDSISYGVIERRNSMQIDIRSISTIDRQDIQGRTGSNQEGINTEKELGEPKADQGKQTKSSNTTVNEINNEVVFSFGKTFKTAIFPSKGLEVGHVSEDPDLKGLDAGHVSVDPDLKSHGMTDRSKSMKIDNRSNSNLHALISKVPFPDDVKDIQDRAEFNQVAANAKNEVSVPKADQEKPTKSSNTIVNAVSLTDFFTSDQIAEHISSLRKKFVRVANEEETGIDANTCQLCLMQKLYFTPVPIFCLSCGIRIKRSTPYFCSKEEEFDAQRCFCSVCYKASKDGYIKFNGASVSKANLEKRNNGDVLEEPWVECNKCKRWQHQICALYNNKKDLDCTAEYTCPFCHVKEIENGMHVPLPKTAIFGAKELPRTMLSDHLEKRLIERLMQERADWEKVQGNKNLDEVIAAKSLYVREVFSVDKQLKVNKEFLDIIPEENYPAEFSYRSRVILLFQKIEGADVCIFGMYTKEFGSQCGGPNQRCIYITYLDSVKYFRPERATMSGEALRTFVYHEILIGYLDFCKKRGFLNCYIWACPPSKGDDYILNCKPGDQKTPKNDKLRRWYYSLLKKATEENIVVGLTNIYDHFFDATEKWDFKLTASRLPYFDGDYWCYHAMEIAKKIEKECGGEYETMLKKIVPNRSLKALGRDVNPSKDAAKDILVMQKLGQKIMLARDDFMIVHLQHSCIHCHEVIVSGKRWFCTECKKFQECERCHSSDVHTSKNGKVHTLCQVVEDFPFNNNQNDTIIENGLFENRNNFLSFCQKNQFQFDTLRRAKYSSMMIIYYLNNPPTLLSSGTCSICYAYNVFQKCWKCEICPECTVCSACYKDRGANSHEHKLIQKVSTELSHSENQESKQETVLMPKLMEVLQHASQCSAINAKLCSYSHCFQIKKLFSHGSRCTIRANGGCHQCKRIWSILIAHSKNCKDSKCNIPRCRDLKKNVKLKAMQSKSRHGAAVCGK